MSITYDLHLPFSVFCIRNCFCLNFASHNKVYYADRVHCILIECIQNAFVIACVQIKFTSIMSNKSRRFGLRSREKLKLKSQNVCSKCKRNFFPSSYSESNSDIDDDEICIDCNAKQKTAKQSEPPLSSNAQQSSNTSNPAITRQSHVLPAFKFIIPMQKTFKKSNNTAQSSSTMKNDIEPTLNEVESNEESKGTIKFEHSKKIRATSQSIQLSSSLREPNEENDNAGTNKAATSFERTSSLDPVDNNINRTNRIREMKIFQRFIPKQTNKNSLKTLTTPIAQQKMSVANNQFKEKICSTSNGKTDTNTKSGSIETPVATRVSPRIRKPLIPFGLNCSPASTSRSGEYEEHSPPAKIAKSQRTSTNTQSNEGNTDPEIQAVPIDQIITETPSSPTDKVDNMNMIVIHSRVHSSKEKEITSSEMLPVRPMNIKQEPIVKETNTVDLDIQKDDSIETLREKFPKVSQFELEYILFLSKGKS